MILQQFVFGYGSLICPHSRAITAPALAERTVTPVLVNHVERTWAKKASMTGMTAMGVRFMEDAECVGVLLPVNDTELAQFDQREKGYDRVQLKLEQVETVPFLDPDEHYDEDDHDVFLQAKQQQLEDDGSEIKIWMYIQRELSPPSEDTPIAQSYVDTILRGCLTISEDFAEQFIANTKGWTPSELDLDEEQDTLDDDDSSLSSSNNSDDEDVYWVNDRHDPIYTRGDQDYMLQHGHKLDRLLQKHRDEFQHRARHVAVSE